jgi:hypothetical protein
MELHALRSYNPTRAKKLRLAEVKETFDEMKDET